METTLHQQLKQQYAEAIDQTEVTIGPYRIDAISDEHLVEIQLGSLAAIRDKVQQLLVDHRVIVVKPIFCRKFLVKRRSKRGKVLDRRTSPKRCTIIDLFSELVYFTSVFPHPNLRLDAPLVEVEEWRYPGHGRRRRRRVGDFIVEDQRLLSIRESYQLSTSADLAGLIPSQLPTPFHTADLADGLQINRGMAQRIAYCLRKTGAVSAVGKSGNTWLYEFSKTVTDAA